MPKECFKVLSNSSNLKLDKTMQIHEDIVIFNVSMPVRITCPCAKYCIDGCYAETNTKRFKDVQEHDKRMLELSKSKEFVQIVNDDIKQLRKYKNPYVRLHVRGDFYNVTYLKKWVKIANDNPNVKFYAYTKSVSIVKSLGKLPDNLVIAFSYGGKEDNLIDPTKDKHVIVVKDKESIPKGYVDCGDNDLMMFNYDKIAIVYHGTKSFDKTNWGLVKLPE